MQNIDLNNYEAFLLDYSEGNLSAEEVVALKAFAMAHPELAINLDDYSYPALIKDIETIDFKEELKKHDSSQQDDEILGYIEQTLLPAQRLAFEEKLRHDKHLAAELELYKRTLLTAPAEQLEHKASLYKTDDNLLLNNPLIAYFEGQLPAAEKEAFEKELRENTGLAAELAMVSNTRLVADATLVYPNKKALKKHNKVIVLFSFRNVAAMAAAILLLFGLVVLFNYFNKQAAIKKEYAGHTKKYVKQPAVTLNTAVNPSAVAGKGIVAQATIAEKPVLHTPAKTRVINAAQNAEINGKETPAPEKTMARREDEKQQDKLPNQPEETTHDLTVLAASNETTTAILKDSSAATGQLTNTDRHYQVAVEAAGDDEPYKTTEPKKGFWKRAVQLARQANKLGVKSVDGEEKPNNTYYLSFNSFSVEKK